MMNGWTAFRDGLARALIYWPVIAIVFAVNVVSAFAIALLPSLNLFGPAHSAAFRQAADGVDSWLMLETAMSLQISQTLGSTSAGLQDAILPGVLGLLAALPLAWLAGAFLSGGALLTYAESPAPFGWRRFLWGCWRWFASFAALGVIQGLGTLLITAPLGALALYLAFVVRGWQMWIGVPLLGLLILFWAAVSEYSGAFMIRDQSRNPLRALGHAILYAVRRPAAVFGLYGLAILLLAAINAAFHFGLSPLLPLAWWPLVFAARQAFVAARLWARLARLAGGVAMIAQ